MVADDDIGGGVPQHRKFAELVDVLRVAVLNGIMYVSGRCLAMPTSTIRRCGNHDAG